MRYKSMHFEIDTLLTEKRDLFRQLSVTKSDLSIESESPRIWKLRNMSIS